MSVIARPPLHCRYRGHHNCFHKGSLGMSCVYRTSWLLCRPLGPLTPRRSEMESRRLSSAENTHLHTWRGNRPNVCSSSWNERWSWDGNMFEYLTVSNHVAANDHFILNPIFFVVFEPPCASTLTASYLCKLLQQKGQAWSSYKSQAAAEAQLLFVCLLTQLTHWCHCQNHVLMAPDLQIFSSLQGAVAVSRPFTVCRTCFSYVSPIFCLQCVI